MKKALATVSTAGAFLTLAPQTLALQICDPSKEGRICNQLTAGGIETIIRNVISFIFVVAVIICLFYLIWGGLRWITSQGEKAGVESARSQIINALIGLVLIFLSYIILNIVLHFFGLDITTIAFPSL